MKKTLELQEIRNKDMKTLMKEITEFDRKLVELRFNSRLNKQKNHKEILAVRKKIARIWTVISEKVIQEENKIIKKV